MIKEESEWGMTHWWNSGPDLKVMLVSGDSLPWMLMDIIFKVDCIYFVHCFCLPRIPCFFLEEHLSCGELSVGRLSYIVYFSYWSKTTHSTVLWLLVTCSLESAHFPASFPTPFPPSPRVHPTDFLAVLSTAPCALHDWMSLHMLFPLFSYSTFITLTRFQ